MNYSNAAADRREMKRVAANTWSGPGRKYDEVSLNISSAIEHCVNRLAPSPGQRILDVATGTGWASRRVAAYGADVIGIDIAEGLLDAARELADEQNLAIDYKLADAEELPFPDDSFDGVISTFGVMFASDQEAAIRELVRVCKPGARLAIAAWRPEGTVPEVIKCMVPFRPSPPEGTPMAPSPFNWGDPHWVKTALEDYFDLGTENGITTVYYPDAEQSWQVYTSSFGPMKALADNLDADRLAEFKTAYISWLEQFDTELGSACGMEYLVTLGTKK